MAVAYTQMAVITKASGRKISDVVQGVSSTQIMDISRKKCKADFWKSNETDTVNLS